MRYLVLAGVYVASVCLCFLVWWLATSPSERQDSTTIVLIVAIVLTYVVGNVVDRLVFKKKS